MDFLYKILIIELIRNFSQKCNQIDLHYIVKQNIVGFDVPDLLKRIRIKRCRIFLELNNRTPFQLFFFSQLQFIIHLPYCFYVLTYLSELKQLSAECSIFYILPSTLPARGNWM